MSVIAKYALDYGLSPRIFVAARLVIAFSILSPLALVFERPLLEQNLYYTGMQLTTPTFTSGMFNLLPAITFVMACIFRLEKVAIHSHRGKAKVLGTCVAVAGAMLMTFWRGQVIPLPWNSLLHAKKIHRHDEDILRGGLMLVCSCLSWSFYVILQRNKLKALKLHPNVTVLDVSQQQRFTLLGGWHRRRVSIFNPINLIATAVISSVVLSEQMFVGRIIGAFVIIIGISFVLWGKMGEQTTPPPPPPPPEPEATEKEMKIVRDGRPFVEE
ncbi:nodulin MtN21 /EamA-like transporter family protein [Arabidopsis thaliana]|uniref:Nodulin MtN21 /EamA-like transporter family protein n=1 Tax=Arabidopsis thaliana TaxID=3702 RepID=F4JRS9_ARATH|nr:nodulin MtN21 /EamA-like transporter family protein [Arabidopsis thaliana]AEE84988.1 nodulin MtN21 /EamA-like transporter family protein [Arabidopsis thaliana]|eukprot:NP_194228.4 nodulin MtN21 /EamA-like transporter family protein [Arabidopsis thaliana]